MNRNLPTFPRRALACVALGLLVAPIDAQIRVDPAAPGSQRPTVLSTGNGVPLVNIQTPGARGVSINRYTQFDVGAPGAVLNNSRRDVDTQIGGRVPGNPWLARGSARVIVNQVHSNNPTYLNGPIEVAGQRAELVVVNPAGIRANGGRFINAQGVTLSTGLPVFSDGGLDAFRVSEGVVGVEGLGLDSGDAEHTRILARAMELNAGLWADHLTVVTGSNEVAALASGEQARTTPIASSGAAPPAFMLDVGAIGGMYARHIYLRGTDQGLGVNLGGEIAARQQLTLHSDGRLLVQGSLQSAGELRAQAASVHNLAGGQIVAAQQLAIQTPGRLENAGLIEGATVQAQADVLDNRSALRGDEVLLQARTLHNGAGAAIAASERLDLALQDSFSNAGSLQSDGALDVRVGSLHNAATGKIVGLQDTVLRTDGALDNAGLIDLTRASVQAQAVQNSGRLIAEQLSLSAERLGNAPAGVVAARERLDLQLRGTFTNEGRVHGQASLRVGTSSIHNTAGGEITGDAAVSLDATDELSNAGLIDGASTRMQAGSMQNSGRLLGDALAVDAQTLTNARDAVIGARQQLETQSAGAFSNAGQVHSLGALSVAAGSIHNAASGEIAATGALSLKAAGTLTNAGLIDGADTHVQAGTLNNTGRLYGDALSIVAQSLNNEAGGVIAAREQLDLQVAGTLSNRDEALLLSAGAMVLAADRLENRSARIEALGDLDVKARELLNANEHVQVEVVQGDTSTTRTVYFTPGGEVDSSEIAWMAVKPRKGLGGELYVLFGRSWILTKTSAEALGVSDPKFSAWYHGAEPFVAGAMVMVGNVKDQRLEWQEAQFHYGPGDPIWAGLGVAPPERDLSPSFPGPMPREQDFDKGDGSLPDLALYRAALSEWTAKAQPWIDLGAKLGALRKRIDQQLLPFDVYQTVTETAPALRTAASRPGQILAGGNAKFVVDERFTNQDSLIVAGRTLTALGTALDNRAIEFSAELTRQGTAYVWGVTGRDCDAFDCSPTYGWLASPIDQRFPVQLKLNALRVEQGAPDAPKAPSANIAPQPFTIAPGAIGSILSSALFRTAAQPRSAYLLETDPRFTGRRQWLSADHQLALLGMGANAGLQRLGDGFIEQRLVREQFAQLSGQRFLGDFRDDEAQYLALLEAGATWGKAHQLRPGISLSAQQVAALTSDLVWLETQEITLADGSTHSVLVPRVYLRPREGDLSPQGALIAGQRVEMDLHGELVNSGQVAGRELVQIDAQGVRSPGRIVSEGVAVVRAQQDIDIRAGEVSARNALVLNAGRDLIVVGTTVESTDGQAQTLHRVARLHLSDEAGELIARAGRDVRLTAAAVQAGVVDMHAGRDLTLGTVLTRDAPDATRDEKNFGRVMRSAEQGTAIEAGEVLLSAGRDVNTRAAQVQAEQDLTIQAGRDVNISAGEASYQVEHGVYAKSSGVLGSSSLEIRRLDSHTTAQGSSLGGRNVTLRGGRDVEVRGSDVVADEDLGVDAQRDVRVLAEGTSHRQERFKETRTSGVFGSGAGLTLGSQQQSSEQESSGTGAAGSSLGAIRGHVTVRAGRAYEQLGSDVLAGEGDVDVRARTIDITEARTTERRRQEDKQSESGLSLSMGGAAVQALQSFAGTAEALDKTDDRRMQALGAATAALQVKQGMEAAGKAMADPKGGTGVSVNISIGGSSSRSVSEGSADSAQGSRVLAGKNLTLIAEGGGEDSDIRVRGSELKAGHTAHLKADDQVDLRAAGNTVKERTDSENQSASIGIGFQFGSSEVGWGIVASATDIHSEFTSVAEQSGLHAGDGGFDVRVQSKTRLKGGAITSTQPAGEQGRPRLRVGGACLSEAAGRASTLKSSSSRRRLAAVSSQPVPRTCPGTANDTR
jgi:filamentous hemagglutinin